MQDIEITSVKIAGNGYLVNGNKLVPTAVKNRYYQAVQKWIADGNTPEPEKDLEALKLEKKHLVNREREARKFLAISYDGDEFDVSDWDIAMISSLLADVRAGKQLPSGNFWRTKNNNQRSLTETDLNNLSDLIKNQVQVAYEWSWTKKQLIDAAANESILGDIDLELNNIVE